MSSFIPPPELKAYKRFVTQARKLDKFNPLVAYYCRLFIVKEASKLPRTESSTKFIVSLFDRLEADKPTAGLQSDEIDSAKVKDFGDLVFHRADTDDRNGNANLETSAAFMTASIVYETLSAFDSMIVNTFDGIHEKIKYSQWKAVDIHRAIKNGEVPVPGGFGDEEEEEKMQLDEESSELKCDEFSDDNPPDTAEYITGPTESIPKPSRVVTRKDPAFISKLSDAEDVTREALSAIRFGDVATALDRLHSAINILQ